MTFASAMFLGGLVAAAGPLVIHLLNRRRYRTVAWPAMQFLEQALRRRRRVMELRDVGLLVLRTLAVVLFVLAMARPVVPGGWSWLGGESVHVVLVVDNSLSMGVRDLEQSRLEAAKSAAGRLVESLPAGSTVSIVPAVGGDDVSLRDVHRSGASALDALARIELADAGATVGAVLQEAVRAQSAGLQAGVGGKGGGIVLFGDLQAGAWGVVVGGGWQGESGSGPVRVVSDWGETPDNTSVTRLELLEAHGVSDALAELVVEVSHFGQSARRGVLLSVRVEGVVVQERVLDLEPGQRLEELFSVRMPTVPEGTATRWAEVSAELSPDALPEDDARFLVVAVMGAATVVFVDELGAGLENRSLGLLGESFALRQLVAAGGTGAQGGEAGSVRVRHVRAEQLSAEVLGEARLVVLAGVDAPGGREMDLLERYVREGGNLLVFAGDRFDAGRWTALGWRDGDGVLGAPLASGMIGRLPRAEDEDWDWRFGLAVPSVVDGLWCPALPPEVLEEMLGAPWILQAVAVDEEGLQRFAEREREGYRGRAGALGGDAAEPVAGSVAGVRPGGVDGGVDSPGALLAWRPPVGRSGSRMEDLSEEEWLAWVRPAVVGRYDRGEAFVVRRRVGKGLSVLVTTSVSPTWNTIARQPAVLVYHQMVDWMLRSSLEERSLVTGREVRLPIAARLAGTAFSLYRPGSERGEPLVAEAVGSDRYALVLRDVYRRGFYRVRPASGAGGGVAGEGLTGEEEASFVVAVNGEAGESNLRGLSEDEWDVVAAGGKFERVSVDAEAMQGAMGSGGSLWWYLLAACAALLMAEMVLLGRKKGAVTDQEGVSGPAGVVGVPGTARIAGTTGGRGGAAG